MSAPSPPSSAAAPASGRALLWLVAVGFFMQTLDSTIVNTALPTMAASLNQSPLHMQAAVVAYSLTMAAIIPATGWLADRFGTRRIFLLAIVLFTLGSAACAASVRFEQLVAARVLQGMGGAMLLPVGRLTVLRSFPREKYLAAITFVAMPGMIGPLVGPTLGGWLVQVLTWHWIFLINIPVGIVGAFAALRIMPNLRGAEVRRFDLTGYVFLVVAMLAISLSLDGLGGLAFQHATVVVLILIGLAALAAYWLRALRVPEPLFSPSLFAIPSFRAGILGNLFARVGASAMPFMIPLLMQLALGYNPAEAGMLMLPLALANLGMKRVITAIITRHGYRRVLVGNTLVLGCMIASFALMGPEQPMWLRIVQLACMGAVNSMQFTGMNAVTLKDLGAAHASSGNSMLSMVQMLGMSLGVTTAAALLAAYTGWLDAGTGAAALPAFRATFVTIGLLTLASAGIFWQLAEEPSRKKSEPQEL